MKRWWSRPAPSPSGEIYQLLIVGSIMLLMKLKAANVSYIMIAGTAKDNYRELKEELSLYTVEDLLNLKRYHALNLIRYDGGWARFISKLPKPII